jgi:hypothetical protein
MCSEGKPPGNPGDHAVGNWLTVDVLTEIAARQQGQLCTAAATDRPRLPNDPPQYPRGRGRDPPNMGGDAAGQMPHNEPPRHSLLSHIVNSAQ